MKRHLKSTLFCFAGLLLFAYANAAAAAPLTKLVASEHLVTPGANPDHRGQDDNVCEVADDEKRGDESPYSKHHDQFAALATYSLSRSHSALHVFLFPSSPSHVSLDVSCIPNRAPPVA